MAINIADNFSYQGKKSLDSRTSYATLAAMKAVTDANIYEGCEAYCAETDKYYMFKSTNPVDESTGKWRERVSGGGGGHTIEDVEGTDLTQRDTLQFGEGLLAEDDDTNEKTVVTLDPMPSEDMDEVVDVYPTAGSLVSIVNAFNRGDIYSTDEKMIGQWTDGKPLYQKTLVGTISVDTDKTSKNSTIGNISEELDTVVSIDGVRVHENKSVFVSLSVSSALTNNSSYVCNLFVNNSTGNLVLEDNRLADDGRTVIATVKYTKTTDTAISIGSTTEYSTDEKIVGTWIDEKPIFQKTIETTTPTCTSQGAQAEKYVEIGEEVERFISVEGFFRIPNTADMPLNSVFKANSTITYSLVRGNPNIATNNPNTIYISVSNTNWSDRTCYVTFQYTKITT